MIRRDPLGMLFVLLLILSLGVVVWATRNPQSEVLERAEGWRIIGSLVEGFRSRYLPPERVEHDAPEVAGTPDREVGVSAEIGVSQDVVWVGEGTALFEEANAGSRVVETVRGVERLPVLAEDGDWYRVLRDERLGWVHLPGYREGIEPPLGSEPEPPKPLEGRPPDAELLASALALLDEAPGLGSVGGYRLHTDVRDEKLLRVLDGVARNVEQAYADRFGIVPIDRPRESIVLFASENVYRRFQNSLERLSGLPAVGLVSRGVVAVYVGARGQAEVAATLIHELVHLLNRRALGPALPPWLDEGLADDLSYSAIDESGKLLPGELAGSSVDLGSVVIWKGGRAAALELKRALIADRAVSLEELLGMEWRAFVDPRRRLHYPQSALFVRYLVAADPQLRLGFHDYLRAIAAGESVSPEALLMHLDRSWEQLDEGFRTWALEGFVGFPDSGPGGPA